MLKKIFILFIFLFSVKVLLAQDTSKIFSSGVLIGNVVDGDTIYYANIKEVVIFPERKFKNWRQARKYNRMIRNLKKVLPYAKIAKAKMSEMNEHFKTLNTEKEQKKYVKQVEKEMRAEFEGELVRLTISQGRLLIKLVDRETGNTSYELVKELKGSFSAFFWQTIARLFGSNLKLEFDAAGEDRLIDELIIMIENGQL